jgi:hypothetical protein
MSVSHQNILTVRLVIIERIVRTLMKDKFLSESNPIKAFDKFSTRFQELTEKDSSKLPNDKNSEATLMLFTENSQAFFDALLLEIQKSLPNQDKPS